MAMIQRPSLSRTMLQMQLARFYDKPVARVSTSLILSILCVTFFAFAAIRPTLQTMADLIKQIEQKREVDQKLTVKINALSTAQKELSEKEETVKSVLGLAVPSTPQFNELLRVLEKLASEHSVLLVAFTTAAVPVERTPLDVPGTKAPTLESIEFSLAFEGSYEQLAATLQDIQNLKRIMIVDQFLFTETAQDNSTKLLLTVSGRAFTFNEAGSTGK